MGLRDILGSLLLRRNEAFDPSDPTSTPYAPKRTGFGRFASRLAGADPEIMNLQYEIARSHEQRQLDEQKKSQDDRQAFQKSEREAGQQYSQERQEAGHKHDWELLASRLGNQAILDQQERNERGALRREQEAQDLFQNTGTWDPIEQQSVLRRIREHNLNMPRGLGGGSFWDPQQNEIFRYEPGGFQFPGMEEFQKPGSWQPVRRPGIGGPESPNSSGSTPNAQISPQEFDAAMTGPAPAQAPTFKNKLRQTYNTLSGLFGTPDDMAMTMIAPGSVELKDKLIEWLRKRKQPTASATPTP